MPLQNFKSSCNALTKPTSHEAITVAGLVNISQPVVSHTPNTESPENMVSLEAVRAHNSNLEDLGTGLVAVFVGGTSGIGLYAAREFIRHTLSPTVYLVGRNEIRATEIIDDLKSLNPSSQIRFLKADVSLLKEVDSTCAVIRSQVNHVNVLFLSCGIFTLNRSREDTAEGLDKKLSLHYYARMRFIHNLMPQLTRASCILGSEGSRNLSRVISVLGGGHETELYLDDLDLQNHYGVENCDIHATTMTSLMVEEFASRYPSTTFIHTYPGIVNSGISRESGRFVGCIVKAVMFLGRPWMVSEKESGERSLFAATSREISTCAKSNTGDGKRNAIILNWDGSEVGNRRLLEEYRKKGVGDMVWKHTEEIFLKASKVPS
ncbi:hypothetical protein AtubIFM57258_009379 [Aspergillus tubingensis]|nr:hypothetical protein AtubIFM57258_009379 [Aspergillus tubingensis]